jgi:hypothetical protein
MSREDNSRAFVLGFALARLEMQAELDQVRSAIGSELEALRVEVEETGRELAAAHRELEILRTLRVLAYEPDDARPEGGETPLLN